ncbi:MAG: metal-dependent hydrolase [archaeon]|nr:metal-dependent hydrolase [archaeon]
MPFAVVHIITAFAILGIVRHYFFSKKTLTPRVILIGGIAGLLPDLDIPLGWVYDFVTGTSLNLHGLFLHSVLFPTLTLLIAIVLFIAKKKKLAVIFSAITFGLILHSSLDCLFGGVDKNFLWPLNSVNSCPEFGLAGFAEELDAMFFVLWLGYLEFRKKVKDYI